MRRRDGLIIARMVINMDESRLSTIGQIEEFLSASTQVEFSAHSGDTERDAHISRVLRRFDYPRRNKRERGVLLAYLRHISGYSRPQPTRLVARWHANRLAAVPLAKRYAPPGAPFARKYTPGHCSPAATRLQRVWRCPLRAPGHAVGLAPVQPAQEHRVPCPAGELDQDSSGVQPHRRAPGAAAQWAGRLCAHRHRAPGRSGWHQGGLSHHLRGRR